MKYQGPLESRIREESIQNINFEMSLEGRDGKEGNISNKRVKQK